MFLLQGFTRPHDLAVDVVHNAVVITEIGPNKIWKFVPYPSKLLWSIREECVLALSVNLSVIDDSLPKHTLDQLVCFLSFFFTR